MAHLYIAMASHGPVTGWPFDLSEGLLGSPYTGRTSTRLSLTYMYSMFQSAVYFIQYVWRCINLSPFENDVRGSDRGASVVVDLRMFAVGRYIGSVDGW